MMHNENNRSGEAKPLSSLVREYIARNCVTLASHMSAGSLINTEMQVQTNTKNNDRTLDGRN